MSDSGGLIAEDLSATDLPDNEPQQSGSEDGQSGAAEERSYLQIFKSSAIIAGSSLVNVGFSIIRNKSAALLLGPEGVGLMGLFWSIIELVQAFAGGGLLGSGVRQIAEANGSGDQLRIARTAVVLKWLSIALGLAGAIILVCFAGPIASLTFGDPAFTGGVTIISLAVLFRLLAAGQTALLQGLRRIGDLARSNILSVVIGTTFFVAIIYVYGAPGVVYAFVFDGVVIAAVSWWYARKVKIERPRFALRVLSGEARAMFKLGLVFMASAVLLLGASYAVRIIVTHEAGIHAAGLYQAAWAIASLYAGFILQAMGVDFYPRLTAAAQDNPQCNRLVNEQTQVSVLLAGPGLIATLTLAPVVIHLFYSSEFESAVGLLRWFCLGMMLRIIAWPMGFIVLAKNEQKIFFWTEVAAAVVQVGLAWVFIQKFGPIGAGLAFFGLYVWHGGLIYVLVRKLSGFRWSAENLRLGLLYVTVSAAVCLGFVFLDPWIAMAFGLAVTAACSIHSLVSLLALLPPEKFPAPLRRWLPRSA